RRLRRVALVLCRRGGLRFLPARVALFQVGEDVLLGDPAVLAGAANRARIEAVLGQQRPDRGTVTVVAGGFALLGGRRLVGRLLPGRLLGSGRRLVAFGLFGRRTAVLDHGEGVAFLHRVAGTVAGLSERAVLGRGHLENHLLGLEF